jgi:curli production assembly/transport component CsgE
LEVEGKNTFPEYEGYYILQISSVIKKIILTGFLILVFVPCIKAQNYSDSGIISFGNYLQKLADGIEKRDSSYQYYSEIIDSLQLLKISSMPEFQKIVYEDLPGKLKQWEREKPTIDYIVKPGDTLWEIARRQSIYNNPDDWEKIFKENKNKITNPDMIYPLETIHLHNPNFVKQMLRDSSIYNPEDTLKTFTSEISEKTFKDIEIEGLIVDQTQTKIGHDFYDLFYSGWVPPSNFGDYTIVIEEKPLPQLGTQVSIVINDDEIFQNILQPRYDVIQEMAQYGIQVSANYIENYQTVQKQLAGDDLQGSGIF